MKYLWRCTVAAIVATGGIARAQNADAPSADRPILFADQAMIESVKGELSLAPIAPRLVSQTQPFAPDAVLPTIVRDGDKSWKFYGQGKSGLVYAESVDGFTWKSLSDQLNVPADGTPGFAPFLDADPRAPVDQKYKALAGSKRSGGLFALASSDGKSWRKLAEKPSVISAASEAFYGRNSVFWSEQAGAYVAFVSELRDGKRVISRTTSKDFLTWDSPIALSLNAEGEDICSATVFPHEGTNPPLLVAMLTRTASGKSGPADVCLALSRDAGATFARPALEAWVRPEQGAAAWQDMTASPLVEFVRPAKWFGSAETMFYAGGRRYEMFQNRLVACRAPALPLVAVDNLGKNPPPTQIITKPFVVAGDTLVFNLSTDTTGGLTFEFLDEQGKPIAGYTSKEAYYMSPYLWVPTDEAARTAEWTRGYKYRRAMFGDAPDMAAMWRWRQKDEDVNKNPKPQRVIWWPDWNVSELRGRTLQLRLEFYGADLFSFATIITPQQKNGTLVVAPRP